MGAITRVDDTNSAIALADLLNGTERERLIVVVTIPASQNEPWIDVVEIAQEAGNLADVFLMPTSDVSWDFSERMAEGTQVFGGAGRVYPVGTEWQADLSKSPLRFAFNPEDGNRATQLLISDMFRMASAAGLLQSLPSQMLRKVDGVVKMVVAGRALVDTGNASLATVAEELVVDDVAIERLMAVGQRVSGWFDAESRRIDVAKSLRTPNEALAVYSVGDVVLAKVATVKSDRAELMLYPKTTAPSVTVDVWRSDVTANPYDDLRELMTVGEVIPARVTAAGPRWSLVLSDVDDDEPILTAPSLLPGGPAWLIEELDEPEADEDQLTEAPALPMPTAAPDRDVSTPAPEPQVAEALLPEAPAQPHPRPSPAMLDHGTSRPNPAPSAPVAAAPQQKESTRGLLLKIDGLVADVTRLMREGQGLAAQLRAATDERAQLRYLLDQAEHRANKMEHDLKVAKARLRKAGNSKASSSGPGPQFADPEQRFRYLVLTQWATRTMSAEQRDRPLPGYVIGPRFLDSLAELEGIADEKVADVVFEILTGLAPQVASREVHRLRTGTGGDDPIRTRDDGAVAWRASLQINTPSARRIHYWRLPNGQFELAQVATHDDFDL
ncbi:hypothetical protein [Demequina sp.]|uniref:hypothetical protein n=1 Tax=Demequina sp. TaxID=2050685 RepID=UPI0025C20577|nr:hypothetical protein [Demequina sp.]